MVPELPGAKGVLCFGVSGIAEWEGWNCTKCLFSSNPQNGMKEEWDADLETDWLTMTIKGEWKGYTDNRTKDRSQELYTGQTQKTTWEGPNSEQTHKQMIQTWSLSNLWKWNGEDHSWGLSTTLLATCPEAKIHLYWCSSPRSLSPDYGFSRFHTALLWHWYSPHGQKYPGTNDTGIEWDRMLPCSC